jgi:hypothetical protein
MYLLVILKVVKEILFSFFLKNDLGNQELKVLNIMCKLQKLEGDNLVIQ